MGSTIFSFPPFRISNHTRLTIKARINSISKRALTIPHHLYPTKLPNTITQLMLGLPGFWNHCLSWKNYHKNWTAEPNMQSQRAPGENKRLTTSPHETNEITERLFTKPKYPLTRTYSNCIDFHWNWTIINTWTRNPYTMNLILKYIPQYNKRELFS